MIFWTHVKDIFSGYPNLNWLPDLVYKLLVQPCFEKTAKLVKNLKRSRPVTKVLKKNCYGYLVYKGQGRIVEIQFLVKCLVKVKPGIAHAFCNGWGKVVTSHTVGNVGTESSL